MKKEIIISDINFADPQNDQKYTSNIIRNLLGNYYFALPVDNYLYTPTNYQDLSSDLKPSIASSEEDVVISSVQEKKNSIIAQEEYPTITFNMSQWQAATQQQLDNFEKLINDKLSKSYYYGLSTNVDPSLFSDYDRLINQYGEHYFDHSIAMPTPFAFPNNDDSLQQQLTKNSINGVYSSTCKITSLYNYYDKGFQDADENLKTQINNAEQAFYNYYALFYYSMQLKDQKQGNSFYVNNIFPLIKDYGNFLFSMSQEIKEKTSSEFIKNMGMPLNPVPINKQKVIFYPDSMKFLNDINYLKYEQPFGIELSFPPQQKRIINSLLGNLSTTFGLEKYVYSKNKLILNQSASCSEIKTDDLGSTQFKYVDNIEYIRLNEWFQKFEESTEEPIDEKTSITFTKTKTKESQFLHKIKKFLLQKKLNALINSQKRSFLDIVAGEPAYNEVLFYEIKKYKKGENTPLQSILLSNTEEIDFYKYFDTQIDYKSFYEYEVIAWTIIIGNRYKYFDRVDIPKKNFPNDPNAELEPDGDYYPRFKITKDNNGVVIGKLQFGVYNEPDVILAGIPYVIKDETLPIKTIGPPPPPPEVVVIPYKNVDNRIKFFVNPSQQTYRDEYKIQDISYLYQTESGVDEQSLFKQQEKMNGHDDNKVTFSGIVPIKFIVAFKSEIKPETYSDFFKNQLQQFTKLSDPYAGGFEDIIEPNKKYYYSFISVNVLGFHSNPSIIYEVEIIKNSGTIYPIVKVIDPEKKDNREEVFSFKEKFRLLTNPDQILENKDNVANNKKIKSASELDVSKFGSLSPAIYEKKFKIRITSKTTKKKLDINLFFDNKLDTSLLNK